MQELHVSHIALPNGEKFEARMCEQINSVAKHLSKRSKHDDGGEEFQASTSIRIGSPADAIKPWRCVECFR